MTDEYEEVVRISPEHKDMLIRMKEEVELFELENHEKWRQHWNEYRRNRRKQAKNKNI